MIGFILILLFSSSIVCGSFCKDDHSVDITDGQAFRDGTIHKDGVTYPKDKIFSKNINGTLKTFGCFCDLKKCFRKCCPVGFVFSRPERQCVEEPEADELLIKGLDLYYYDSFKKNVGLDSSRFTLLHTRPCYPNVYIEAQKWYVGEDGQLFIEMPSALPPWSIRGPDKYCIDTFVTSDPVTGDRSTHLDALVCFAEVQDKPHFVLSSTCMLISCVFILATVGVYAWLPELRNLHGRVLMVYLLCLFVGFASLASMQIMLHVDFIYPHTCIILSIVIYFALESAFFWLNVMCFDIWWTFSGKRGLSERFSSTRARFLMYCAYAFGIPMLLTILLIGLEFSGLPPHPLMPMLRHQGCFLYGNGRLIYLYSPMLLICVSNVVFFVLTALKINEIKRQTSVLKAEDNGTHDQHRKDKQRLVLYFKLFMVMGINWTVEVISALYPDLKILWNFTDAYNVLIGVIIFVIFVCKRKIFRLIKKRIKSNFQKTPNEDNIDEMKEFSNAHMRRKQMIDQRASQETIRTSIGSANSHKNAVNILT